MRTTAANRSRSAAHPATIARHADTRLQASHAPRRRDPAPPPGARGGALASLPRSLVCGIGPEELAGQRSRLRNGAEAIDLGSLATAAADRASAAQRPHLRRVLNATGVVLHTNLGRAPALPAGAGGARPRWRAATAAVEFDLETGRRGERGTGVERWLTRLTGAEAALVVNNGARGRAAGARRALAAGRQVVVSRGELVEIGGSFRIPEIMDKSGASLLEVGTTNRTHLERLRTGARAPRRDGGRDPARPPEQLPRRGVHHPPDARASSRLWRTASALPLIEDLRQRRAHRSLDALGARTRADGERKFDRGVRRRYFLRRQAAGSDASRPHPGPAPVTSSACARIHLARALRVDKLTLAALEATLPAYSDPARAARRSRRSAMLARVRPELEARARSLAEALERGVPEPAGPVERGAGEVGEGRCPSQRLPGWVVAIEHAELAGGRAGTPGARRGPAGDRIHPDREVQVGCEDAGRRRSRRRSSRRSSGSTENIRRPGRRDGAFRRGEQGCSSTSSSCRASSRSSTRPTLAVRRRHHRRHRPERLRQDQRLRRDPLGDGRAERQAAARRLDGRRDLQRLPRRASRSAWPRSTSRSRTTAASCRPSSARSRSRAACSAPASPSTSSTRRRAGSRTSATCSSTPAWAATPTR